MTHKHDYISVAHIPQIGRIHDFGGLDQKKEVKELIDIESEETIRDKRSTTITTTTTTTHLKVGQRNIAWSGFLPAVPAFHWSPGVKVKVPVKKILLAEINKD